MPYTVLVLLFTFTVPNVVLKITEKQILTGILGFGGTHSLAIYFFCSYLALIKASSDLIQ